MHRVYASTAYDWDYGGKYNTFARRFGNAKNETVAQGLQTPCCKRLHSWWKRFDKLHFPTQANVQRNRVINAKKTLELENAPS